MLSSLLSTILLTLFSISAALPSPGSDLPQLPSYIQVKFSTGAEVTIYYFMKNPNQKTPFGTQPKPALWLASNENPVCPAFCLSNAAAAADPRGYGKSCPAPYCTMTLNPAAVYVENDAITGFWGNELRSCGPDCYNHIDANGVLTPISLAG